MAAGYDDAFIIDATCTLKDSWPPGDPPRPISLTYRYDGLGEPVVLTHLSTL